MSGAKILRSAQYLSAAVLVTAIVAWLYVVLRYIPYNPLMLPADSLLTMALLLKALLLLILICGGVALATLGARSPLVTALICGLAATFGLLALAYNELTIASLSRDVGGVGLEVTAPSHAEGLLVLIVAFAVSTSGLAGASRLHARQT